MTAGRFITFEGIDGAGKSTQIRLAADRLRNAGHQVIETREPGGSPGAEAIRDLLVTGDPGRWSAMTEILLFTAARRDHVERTIQPALDAGKTVLCDRFADSTRVYQGVASGDLMTKVEELHALMIGIEPDLTIILDLDPSRSLQRSYARGGDEDRFEARGLEFQTALRSGFLALADANPSRCRVVDAQGSPEDVAARVAEAMDQHG